MWFTCCCLYMLTDGVAAMAGSAVIGMYVCMYVCMYKTVVSVQLLMATSHMKNSKNDERLLLKQCHCSSFLSCLSPRRMLTPSLLCKMAGWLSHSHAGTVSKRLKLSKNFLDRLVAPSFYIYDPLHRYPISRETQSARAINTLGWEDFAILHWNHCYLENGTR